MEKNSLSIFLPNLAAMVALGHSIFEIVIPGTSITISGDIGVGKTTLARDIIRAAIGEREEIPSPTFTLVQTY